MKFTFLVLLGVLAVWALSGGRTRGRVVSRVEKQTSSVPKPCRSVYAGLYGKPSDRGPSVVDP